MELKIDRISKQYKNRIAVDNVSVTLRPGVYGLLGTNGAGKTTLMRMLCGILEPTRGSISLDGVDVREEAYRAQLGYLPQDFGYYPEFTAQDFLLYFAALKGLPRAQARRRTAELLELVSLAPEARRKVKTFSGGMKQRLGIAQALLNRPRVLILDEPTAGLDPKERARFRDLIGGLGSEDIVLLSTHIVSDVTHIADEILMMKDGQLIYEGKWDESQGDLEAFISRSLREETKHEQPWHTVPLRAEKADPPTAVHRHARALPADRGVHGGVRPGGHHTGVRHRDRHPLAPEPARPRL